MTVYPETGDEADEIVGKVWCYSSEHGGIRSAAWAACTPTCELGPQSSSVMQQMRCHFREPYTAVAYNRRDGRVFLPGEPSF